MRVVFLAVDDEFAGLMQELVYATHPGAIVGSIVSTCSIYRKSPLQAFWFVLRKSGFRYGAEMFKMKIFRRLSGGKPATTPSLLAKKYKVPIHYSENINDEQSLQKLVDWQPDIVVATNFSHIIGASARAIATKGTWNLHKSLLPNYRGMAPSFFALLNGERQCGVTLHEIAKGIDTGPIIRQCAVEILPGDTVYDLNKRTSAAGGKLLSEVLGEDNLTEIEATPQPEGDWPYFTFPSPQEVRRFLGLGLRF